MSSIQTDGPVVCGIVALAGFCGWLIRRIVDAFIENQTKQQAAILENIAAHTKAVDELTKTLTQYRDLMSKVHEHELHLLKAVAKKLCVENGYTNIDMDSGGCSHEGK